MFTTTNNGSRPGQVTPENDEGIVTGQGNNPQSTTNNASDFKSKIIAAYSLLTDYCTAKMIQWQSAAMLVMACILLGVTLATVVEGILHG